MNLIIAVLEDLYTFARDALLALVSGKRLKTTVPTLALPPRDQKIELTSGEDLFDEETPVTFRSTADILAVGDHRPEKNTVMYTGSEHVALFREPTIEFDGVIEKIPYGRMVMVLESRGRWARITHKESTGWVLRDELLDRSAHVYPDFTIGTRNLADDPNTLRIRACIQDEFSAGVAELPLQSSEYVLYKLYRKGGTIVWPRVRPRIEGAWHDMLRGEENIRVSIDPKSGSIMEYAREDGVGHLAYVEAVFPDETLSISEANYPDEGIYNERVLTKEEWRELRPIFMEVH